MTGPSGTSAESGVLRDSGAPVDSEVSVTGAGAGGVGGVGAGRCTGSAVYPVLWTVVIRSATPVSGPKTTRAFSVA
ncbi:hypothetical protein EES39_05005 [Streptomyces sp. ADI92-24]|nr:hypothetical protein EES39_05005 [Streptomyces sp. ADI92-24]